MNTTEYLPSNVRPEDVSIAGWNEERSYRFHVLITNEDDGTFSATALNLPGVGSMGDTEEEALTNFREAAAGVLESYIAVGEAIPWKTTLGEDDIPAGAKRKWILVHV